MTVAGLFFLIPFYPIFMRVMAQIANDLSIGVVEEEGLWQIGVQKSLS